MRNIAAFLALLLAFGLHGSAQSQPNPVSGGARFNYEIIKNFVQRAAAKMPEENYTFRPDPNVRSFSELMGHLADANYRMCSIVAGDDPPMDAGIERDRTTKSQLTRALAESFEYCDRVYRNMTDAAGATIINFDAGGEGTRVPVQVPRLTALAFHTQHAFLHYGNIVTYMRLKGIVPPDSELATGSPVTSTANLSKGDSKRTYSDISGDWFLLIETPNGPITATLSLGIDGAKVTGVANSARGNVELAGTLTSSEIRLIGQLQTLKMVFVGKPGAEAMSGTVDFVGHPSGTWIASRQ